MAPIYTAKTFEPASINIGPVEKNKMGAPEVDANLYLPVAYSVTPESGQGAHLRAIEINVANSLTATDGKQHDRGTRVVADLAVRRLTPVEAERLMGWPDDWTRWKPDGSEMADTHRYRMAGNGVVGTVAEWLGCRIRWVDSLS
jgi:site-specific DNA-cytosine methylase